MMKYQDYDNDGTRGVSPTDAYLALLMRRVDAFCGYVKGGEVAMKLSMMTLTMELEFYAQYLAIGRKSQLYDYFCHISLQECLSCISQIDMLKSKIIYPRTDTEWEEEDPGEFPPLTATRLWNSPNRQQMGEVFYPAFEDFTGKRADGAFSFETDFIERVEPFRVGEGHPIREYRRKLTELTAGIPVEALADALRDALERVRQVFMEQAYDIYCVRTGDDALLEGVDREAYPLQQYYTEFPLEIYKDARSVYQETVGYMIGHKKWDAWRMKNGLTGRPLKQEEKLRYLTELREQTLHTMQQDYPQLWKLRERSGGCDVEVTPESFARTFYGRGRIASRFFRLEWELEYIDERLAALRQQPDEPQPQQRTPQQQAIADFADRLRRLITTCYDRWNGRRCTPAVNQPEVEIVIRRDEMLRQLQQQLDDSTQPLLEYCYPPTSQTKRTFCNYVLRLVDAGCFGSLPKKELAQLLAPIVGLSPGTVTNYLSPA